MALTTRNDFINAQASEKITLAHVTGRARVHVWTVYLGNIWVSDVNYFVTQLHLGATAFNDAGSKGSVTSGTFAYEPSENKVYVHMSDSSDPNLSELIGTYKFFYADAPCTASYDLTNTGNHVYYDARIEASPGYKHKVGVDQKLTSIIGQGSLKLQNNDGGLDEIYDTLIFENQLVEIYSWSRDLPFTDAQKIYRGRVTNKQYNSTSVTFKVKDGLFDLLQNVPQTAYDDTDTVTDSVKGRYKRWIYGRVDGLQLQSIDQIGTGYTLTGTVTGAPASTTLTGSGTTFLADVSPGDTLIVGTQELVVDTIESDTSLTLDDDPEFAFNGSAFSIIPVIPTTTKNREFLVAGHACAQIIKTISSVNQLNRFTLNNTTGLEAGDFVEFATGERLEIKRVEAGNTIVLQQNVVLVPTVGSNVTKQPVQSIFIESTIIPSDKFTITNTSAETKVTLASDLEFSLARNSSLNFTATFTNGSRTVTTSGQPDLTKIVQPRDFIKPTNISFTTYYEVLQVDETTITLRTSFADPNHTGTVDGKLPEYVGDNTIVSANVLGRTVDNTPTGTFIETAADAIKDLLSQIGITNIDTTSFTSAAQDSKHLLSLAIPATPRGSAETVKKTIDKINKSVNGALTLNTSLQLQYRILLPNISDSISEIEDHDVISWDITSVNGDMIRNSLVRYRHKDIDRFTLEEGSNVINYTSDFVQNYVGTNTTQELDVYLYHERSANIMSHREVYFRSMARAEVKIVSDLRLENFNIGDQVVLNFERLYKRFGDTASRKKVVTIVGKTVKGNEIEFFCSDFGNILNRSSIITPNTAPDWTSATEDEKIKYGYITQNSGLINDEEDTANTHLIS